MVKPNERLGNYEVATGADGTAIILGSGAGGVKLLIRRKQQQRQDRDAFLSEARAAASLSHPQIARILDFGESAEKHPYYVMELCEGGSLEDLGRKSGPPDGYTCIQWFFEAASALAHSHQKGILHRDIKPSNLLVAFENGTASIKLIDFGLADHTDPGETAATVIGTPLFAAPEQLCGRAEPASDVFSLGATLLWLLTGKFLSSGDVSKVIDERLAAVSYASHLEALPGPWKTLLGRLLEIDPQRRLQNGSEVLAALHATFPNHPLQPVAWDTTAENREFLPNTALPSQWIEHPDFAWSSLWTSTADAVSEGFGMSVTAQRSGDPIIYEVRRFEKLDSDTAELLVAQGDLFARHSGQLGLGNVILERGADWWSIAWPSLGATDALSWVRQGQTASPGEILAALEPIASALDGMSHGGFESMEIHPSMLIISGGASGEPLMFSLAVSLPILPTSDHPSDSAGTMRGASGASLSARFGSCVYQLLSGRSLPPAAFVNARAYQAIPRLTEKSNRFLSASIAGTITAATCRDVIRGLAHEERIPGASISGSLTSRPGSASMSASASATNLRSHLTQIIPPPQAPVPVPVPVPVPAVILPAPAAVPVPEKRPPTPAPAPAPAPAPPPAPPLPVVTPPRRGPSKWIFVAGAAVVVAIAAGLGVAGWFLLKPQKPVANLATQPVSKPIAEPAKPAEPAPPVAPPASTDDEFKSLIKVPGDTSSLVEAVRRCKTGGTIQLAGGTYPEAIVILKSISIISSPAAVLEDRGLGSNLINIKGPVKVNLQGIQLRNTQQQADSGSKDAPELLIASDGAAVKLDGCTFEGSIGGGISLVDKATATLANCRIRKNRQHGIRISSGSSASLELSVVNENGEMGIEVTNIGAALVLGSGSTISSNGLSGLSISGGASATGTGVEINANKKSGVVISGSGSTATLEAKSVVSGNLIYGVEVAQDGSLTLSDTSVEDNTSQGIRILSGGKAKIDASRIKSNGEFGVNVDTGDTSSAEITNTDFSGHSGAGFTAFNGIGRVTGCRFRGNGIAIYFGTTDDQKTATGTATGNVIHPGPIEQQLLNESTGQVVFEDNKLQETE
jgi:Protein kinase domain/Right handed beta helix region